MEPAVTGPAEVYVRKPVSAEIDVLHHGLLGYYKCMGGVEREPEPRFGIEHLPHPLRCADEGIDGRFHVLDGNGDRILKGGLAERCNIVVEPGMIRIARGTLSRSPAGVYGGEARTEHLRHFERPDGISNRDLRNIRINGTGIEVENRGMDRKRGDLRVCPPAGNHLFSREIAE